MPSLACPLHAQRWPARADLRRCALPAGAAGTRQRPSTDSRPSTVCSSWVAAAAPRRSTCAAVVDRGRQTVPTSREPKRSSLVPRRCISMCPFRQDTTYLAIGERTNANGSKAFREAMLAEDWETCLEIAKAQIRDGAHLLDLCVDYVGRDGVADMRELASRFATASTLPIVLDSTEPAVLQAGLES